MSPASPAVVLAPGWGETAATVERHAAAFAAKGLVAMAIDYRGWGNSEGHVRLLSPVNLDGGMEKDENRHTIIQNATVWVKRTKLDARDQQDDYRNAISFIQGEPGVDPDRIGGLGLFTRALNGADAAQKCNRVQQLVLARTRLKIPVLVHDEALPGLRAEMFPNWGGGAFGQVIEGGTIRVGDVVSWDDVA